MHGSDSPHTLLIVAEPHSTTPFFNVFMAVLSNGLSCSISSTLLLHSLRLPSNYQLILWVGLFLQLHLPSVAIPTTFKIMMEIGDLKDRILKTTYGCLTKINLIHHDGYTKIRYTYSNM